MGIIERKTFYEIIPPTLPKKYEIDFIRGFFDGDGSVGGSYPGSKNSKSKTKTMQLRVRMWSGSKEILEDIQIILQKYGLTKKNLVSQENIYGIHYSTEDSLKLYNLFYKDPNALCLKRKKNRFEELIAIRKKDVQNSKGYIKIK